jgi:hypothetical protein
LQSSEEAAEQCLDHPEANIRSAAIRVLAFKWKAPQRLANKLETILANDPVISVRCDAAGTLACCFRHTNDSRIGRLLADIVFDESAPMELRRAAYQGLFMIREVPRELLFKLARNWSKFDFEFVNTFREINGP